jgi:hypothetical protein
MPRKDRAVFSCSVDLTEVRESLNDDSDCSGVEEAFLRGVPYSFVKLSTKWLATVQQRS